jgi:hypothetical protein
MRVVVPVLLASLSAHAYTPGSVVVTPVSPPIIETDSGCAAPTLAWCQNPANASDPCWSPSHAACQQLIANAFQQSCQTSDAQFTPQPAVLPQQMSGSAVQTTLSQEPFDNTSLTKAGGVNSDLRYANVMQLATMPAVYSAWALKVMTPILTPQHATWESDGTRVNSCSEYVYKKYYDYGRFEEAAASCGSDFICIYNVAAFVGAPGIAAPYLHGRDTTNGIMPVQVRVYGTATTTQPKNLFYTAGQATGWILNQRTSAAEASALRAAFTAGYNAPYTIGSDRWPWHQKMHDQQAPFHMTAAEYGDIERRTQAFQDALDAYGNALTILAKQGKYTICDLDPSQCNACGIPYDNYAVDPAEMPPGWKPPLPCKLAGDYTGNGVGLRGYAFALADLLIAEWRHVSIADGVTVDHGCLGANNKCDWAPKLIALEYLHRFQSERETDYQKCIDETGDSFTNQFPSMSPDPANAPDSTLDAHTDWLALEKWYAVADRMRQVAVKDLPWLDGVTDAFGDHKEGGYKLGDPSWFSGGYSYKGDWMMHVGRDATGRICKGDGDMTGALKADISILTMPVSIVDASLEAYAGRNGDAQGYVQGHLKVLGSAYYLGDNAPAKIESFYLAPANLVDDSFSYSQQLWIGPVPVTVSAGAEFAAGFTVGAQGNAPQGCNATAPLMNLGLTVTPYARVSAFASGALGGTFAGFGAEAGIEGDVTLVDASIPVSAQVALDVRKVDASYTGPALTLSANTKLHLQLLAGEVKAFAEICVIKCWRKEKSIFTWPGLGSDDNLFTPISKSYPLMAVSAARRPR